MEVIKRIISRKDFVRYKIPEKIGNKAEVIILPYHEGKSLFNSQETLCVMKAQEQNSSVSMLNEPEEDAWNKL